MTNETLDLKLAAEFGAVRGEMRGEIGGLRAELHSEIREQTWRLMGAMLASAAILGSILRFA